MFGKVLVPIDGSDIANKAIDTARRMMEEGSAQEVTILTVVQPSDAMPFNGLNMPADFPAFFEEINKAAQKILDKAEERMYMKENVKTQLEFGLPAEIICKTADQDQFDLIIIGNRGLNKLQRIMMGSVSSRVVALSPCPVLVVK